VRYGFDVVRRGTVQFFRTALLTTMDYLPTLFAVVSYADRLHQSSAIVISVTGQIVHMK
jgi:hypothetical protein